MYKLGKNLEIRMESDRTQNYDAGNSAKEQGRFSKSDVSLQRIQQDACPAPCRCLRAIQSSVQGRDALRLYGRDGDQRMSLEIQIEPMPLGLRSMPDRAKRWRGEVSTQPEEGAASTVTGGMSYDLTTAAGVRS